MNKKDMKQKLNQSIDHRLNDVKIHIDWEKVSQERTLETIESYESPKRASYLSIFKYALALSLVVVMGIIFFPKGTEPIPTEVGYVLYEQDETVLTTSIISTSTLITSQSALLNQMGIQLMSLTTSDLDELVGYLRIAEYYMASTQNPSNVVDIEVISGYTYALELLGVDLLGDPIVYRMYYNVDDYIEDDSDNEYHYDLSGIVYIGDDIFEMSARRAIEEDEERVTIEIAISMNRYIRTVYKLEDEEVRYTTTLYENSTAISSFYVKVEANDEIKIEIDSSTGAKVYEFNYEEEDGQDVIQISYEYLDSQGEKVEEGEMVISFILDPNTQTYDYHIYVEDDDESHEYERDRD